MARIDLAPSIAPISLLLARHNHIARDKLAALSKEAVLLIILPVPELDGALVRPNIDEKSSCRD
jgi:hypothetical protein